MTVEEKGTFRRCPDEPGDHPQRGISYSSPSSDSLSVHEPPAASLGAFAVPPSQDPREKMPGRRYTIEDYSALPEERRAELIDGVFYDLDAPAPTHQELVLELGSLLKRHVEERGGDCRIFISPCDVQLDMDEYTMVQPDVFVVCSRDRLRSKRIYGAPDLVIEVLSPSTRKKDIGIKCQKYMRAGVREYWIVDPDREQFLVHLFQNGAETSLRIYSRQEQVPVSIWNGELTIDLEEFWSGFDFWKELP